MNRRIVLIAAIALLVLLAFLVYVRWPAAVAKVSPVAGIPAPVESRASSSTLATTRPKVAPISSLWARPDPKLAARNYRRQGFAWILRQLGVSEQLLDQLADGDVVAVLQELKSRAESGDTKAINILGEIAYQQCTLGRSADTLDAVEAERLQEARRLPEVDADWMSTALREDVAFDKSVKAACSQVVDQAQVMQWVSAEAARGDAASEWLMSRYADNLREEQQGLRNAAAGGFPEAQFELGWAIVSGQSGAAGASADAVDLGNVLRQAAATLPNSQGTLARCEYFGCPGVAPDVTAAVTDAVAAAERGAIDAVVSLGPHLTAAQLDPDAVSAWGLVRAALSQQGCVGTGFSERSMKAVTATLNAGNITDKARALAEQYWQQYGAQIKDNLGCGG